MTERQYLVVSNLAKVRAAQAILDSVTSIDPAELDEVLDIRRGLAALALSLEHQTPKLQMEVVDKS